MLCMVNYCPFAQQQRTLITHIPLIQKGTKWLVVNRQGQKQTKSHQWTSHVDIFLGPPRHTTSVATMRIRRSCQHSSGSFQVDDIARLKDRTPATFRTQHSPNWKYLETKTWKEASLLVSKIFGNDFQPWLCRNAWPPSAKHTWHQSETYLNPKLKTGTSNQQKSNTS